MAHTCNKCSRVNPSDAVYCYYDGVALNGHAGGGGPVSIGQKAFSSPFTLPSGKACNNFDQLALGCQNEWKAALDVLKQGYLEKFLASQGRADLAMAAREAARFPDKDRGLDQFLAKLPTQAVAPPQLAVEPTEINLGTLKVGDERKVELKMENRGMRICYGSVTVENAPWLSVGAAAGAHQKLFQFSSDMTIPVVVQGKKLRASNKPLEAKLVVESNAGDFIVIVKAEVPVKAYPAGSCLAGAKSPRQIAEKAKANAKEAADLFEKGAVEKWYKDNGWAYPVRMPAASGLGAVQQFFEALGLTPPPKVEVSERALNLRGDAGQKVTHQIEDKAQEKRPVYAHGVADQSWLDVGKARLNGRVATIPLTVNVPSKPGETLKAKLTVTANGNQKFVIPVTLAVGGAAGAFEFSGATPTGGGAAAAGFGGMGGGGAMIDSPLVSVHRGRKKALGAGAFAPLFLLLLALGGVAGWDLIGGNSKANDDPSKNIEFNNEGQPIASGEGESGEDAGTKAYDETPHLAISFMDELSRFGISCTQLKDPRPGHEGQYKLLTSHPRGQNNNTRLIINGRDYRFGYYSKGTAEWVREKDSKGKMVEWRDREVETGKKWISKMIFKEERVVVTQEVSIVVGESTHYYDTALIKYIIENQDSKPNTVGIRILFDTFIGSQDGVPFEVGPSEDIKEPYSVDTKAELEKGKVPQYLRALEDPNDLAGKNTTVAVMGLKLKLRNIEPVSKVVLCRWPGWKGAGAQANWAWEYEPINAEPSAPDSCVVVYWEKFTMRAKEERICAITYGLDRIAGQKSGSGGSDSVATSQMRLFTRPAKLDTEFAVSAYVKDAEGTDVKLEVPSEFELISPATQKVPAAAGKKFSTVTWRMKAKKIGTYTVKAVLQDDKKTTAQEPIEVTKKGIFE